MPSDGDEKRWICSRGTTMNLHLVSSMTSIVKEISRDPCLNPSPNKGSKKLKPDKWQSFFDDDGRVPGFGRALKSIILGGVDPSIRPEVWEFLLGCYSSNSTAEYREQLRMARRERYEDLVRECQTMHSTVGTGALAYVIGSRVMDARTLPRDNNVTSKKEMTRNRLDSDNRDGKEGYSSVDNIHTNTYLNHRESSSSSATHDPSNNAPSSDACNCFSGKNEMEVEESYFSSENLFDFQSIPFTNLFEKITPDEKRCSLHSHRSSSEHTHREALHTFQINNNIDLTIEPNQRCSTGISHISNSLDETIYSGIERQTKEQENWNYRSEFTNIPRRISDVQEEATLNTSISNGLNARDGRVSEWLWTLHKIVVDVVRTDNHLNFYGDSRNMARMSDILAVYAWIDPATGYCQGMSDLLSPFVVLYEDNADAFWCFEMLLRRLRENFHMEGPTGVMKKLQILWKILEHTDSELYDHLSLIGAESLHFAFRMLMLLFRRELSFDEALCMWEMMWATDFDEAVARGLKENCLEALILEFPEDSNVEMNADSNRNSKMDIKDLPSVHNNSDFASCDNDEVKSDSKYPFCGLTKANFWAKQQQMQICTLSASTRSIDDEISVFCVAAILITNRQKIMRETNSIDDVIKMFNDNLLKICVKRCIRMAIKIRKKYLYKQIKSINVGTSEQGEPAV